MAKPIVVVGSINLDLVGATHRIPIAGETVAGLSFQTFPGGKGANQAVAAARLGGSVSMLGKLGTDVFGVQLRESLEQSKVNTDGIEVVPGPSGVALITTDTKGANAITVVAGANAYLSPADLDIHIGLIRGELSAAAWDQIEHATAHWGESHFWQLPASRTSRKSCSMATRRARRPLRFTSTASTCCRI